jgi:hypothetical protein
LTANGRKSHPRLAKEPNVKPEIQQAPPPNAPIIEPSRFVGEDGSLCGRPRRAQHIDRPGVSIALAGVSRPCSANPSDKAGANYGCPDLPKGGGLFG